MLTGIFSIDQSTLMEMLRFSISAGENMITFGPAGTGKTEMAMQACEALGYDFCYLNLSVLEAPDLMGLPRIIDDTTCYALPRMLPQRKDWADERDKQIRAAKGGVSEVPREKRPKILLIDEADKAKPELQNPCLELLQFRSINGTKLDVHACIATGNLPEEGAFSQPMSHALTNRCLIYRVEPAFEPWQEWAAGAGVNPLIVGYLSRNTEMLLQPPPEGDDTAYCHPSPRAWTKAARALDHAGNSRSVDFQTLVVAGCVGTGPATNFKVWLEHFRHIEPLIDKLVGDGTNPEPSAISGPDRMMVTALSAVSAVMAETRKTPTSAEGKKKQRDEVARRVKNVFGWVQKIPSEFSVGAVKSTLTMEAIKEFQMTNDQSFMKVFTDIRSSMRDQKSP